MADLIDGHFQTAVLVGRAAESGRSVTAFQLVDARPADAVATRSLPRLTQHLRAPARSQVIENGYGFCFQHAFSHLLTVKTVRTLYREHGISLELTMLLKQQKKSFGNFSGTVSHYS